MTAAALIDDAAQVERYAQLLRAVEGISLEQPSLRFLWNVARWPDEAITDALELIGSIRRGSYPELKFGDEDAKPLVIDKPAKSKRATAAPSESEAG